MKLQYNLLAFIVSLCWVTDEVTHYPKLRNMIHNLSLSVLIAFKGTDGGHK